MEKVQKKEAQKIARGIDPIQMAGVIGNQASVAQWNDSNHMNVVQCLRIINLDEHDKVLQESALRIQNFNEKDGENITTSGFLDTRENLIIICHGGDPRKSGTFVVGGQETFLPDQLAQKISELLPDGYSGEIYINGCYTSTPYKGNTFISLFEKEIRRIMESNSWEYRGTVKGNIGAATTTRSGRESVTPLS